MRRLLPQKQGIAVDHTFDRDGKYGYSSPIMPLALTDLLSPDAPVQGELRVEVPVEALSRLARSLQDGGGSLAVELSVWPLPGQIPALAVEGRVSGTLPMTCQRCLETVPVQVEQELRLAVSASGNEDALPADFEPWPLIAGPVSIKQLLEDELLLALPLVPMHERREECGELAEQLSALDQGKDDAAKVNPFAVLETLKKDLKR